MTTNKRLFIFLFLIAPFLLKSQSNWVDSTLNKLTLEEKIAQLITIRSFANGDTNYYSEIAKRIEKYGYGGVCFFKGTPHAYLQAANLYQNSAKIPLLISIDGEWGPSMRFDSIIAFPRQQTLGAVCDDHKIYQMGALIGEQCNRLGIHFNFIPCVDVNSNPKNPVINTRSFGEDRVNVANKAIAYFQGMNSKNVLGSAKHFPGHGDTDVDSHYDLPIIKHDFSRIDSIDLFPYKMLFKNGINSVMVAHLNIPALDSSSYPSSVSKAIVDTLLRQKLGFEGLVFTDGLEMNAFAKYGSNGQMELMALQAGVDNLLLPVEPEKVIKTVARAVKQGKISEESINEKCRKILQAKYDLKLQEKDLAISDEALIKDLNHPKYSFFNKKLYASAITLLENKNDILPLKKDAYPNIINLNIGDKSPNIFQKTVHLYANTSTFNLDRDFEESAIDSIVESFTEADLIIVSVSNTNIVARRNYGVTPQSIKLIEKLTQLNSKFILCVFASPYVLSSFTDSLNCDALLIGYQEQNEALEMAAHGLFGASDIKGLLPVSVGDKYPNLNGIDLPQKRLALQSDDILGEKLFYQIDSIVSESIIDTVFPGCQVLVAKDGQILYNKSFGTHTYEDSTQKVNNADIYDIASVSKIAATTLALMKLYDEKRFKLDDKVSAHLNWLKHSNKKDITIRQVLAHQAGLQPSLRLHYDYNLYCNTYNEDDFNICIADSIYASTLTYKEMRKAIIKSPMLRKPYQYRYSDIGFHLMAELVQKLTGENLDTYLDSNFYQPLGLTHTSFNPLQKFSKEQIIPTENDTVFRKQLVHGYVHDPTVAMLGGIGGSAGLFSNAEDLVVIMQMLLNKGEYEGKRYIETSTVELFTSPILRDNRRGAGFDKPIVGDEENGPTCALASEESFGHSGFTGTLAWVDPKNQIIYIFLSNRIYPSAQNTKLIKQNTRTKIQRVIYENLEALDF